MENNSRENPANYIIGAIIIIIGLLISVRVDYLLFHSLAELFSIIIAFYDCQENSGSFHS